MNGMLRRDDPETPGRNSRFSRYWPAVFNVIKVVIGRQLGPIGLVGVACRRAERGSGLQGIQSLKRVWRFRGKVVDSVWPVGVWISTVRSVGEAIQASIAPAST